MNRKVGAQKKNWFMSEKCLAPYVGNLAFMSPMFKKSFM